LAYKIEYGLDSELELQEPKKYKVILLNDDFTSMDFVVEILISIFHKSYQDAVAIMMNIHRDGRAVSGIYTKDIAETKVHQVHKKAKESKFPLKALIEEEEV